MSSTADDPSQRTSSVATEVDNPAPARSGGGNADDIRKDAEGQFARQKTATNPDGLHSANPVVTSGNGDATQPLKRPAKSPKK